jgi:hypothetical protein
MEGRWCPTYQKPSKSRCVPLIDNTSTLFEAIMEFVKPLPVFPRARDT